MSKGVTIDDFLKVMANTLLGGNEEWPLSGIQISLYFDIFQSTDILSKVNQLLKKGKTYKEIGQLFNRPTQLRYFLAQNGIVGLKVADIFKIKKVPVEDRTKYAQDLLKILATMTKSDPLCRDGKNLIISDSEVREVLEKQTLIEVSDDNSRSLLSLGVDLYTYAWTLFYNAFVDVGYEIHGPYPVTIDNKKYQLVIKDNLRMNPGEVWGSDFTNDFQTAKSFFLYDNDFDYKLNYYNQPTTESHTEHLKKVAFELDGKSVTNLDDIKNISNNLEATYTALVKHINKLSDLDKIKKGAVISFLKFKPFYDLFEEKLNPEKIVADTYGEVGDQFIKENQSGVSEMEKTFTKLYDPRINTLD